ncbi:hypothetical protein B0H16DRAFT_1686100 [Mycena metata]|uniref:Uncharacterized protein n=1 Tax=Mycena metata TaxID=1033252 RepID=A0AAD7NPW5_9AGAR|nr:hypothetical protein B0H16DRAFT_1686100 [Mycena metata]
MYIQLLPGPGVPKRDRAVSALGGSSSSTNFPRSLQSGSVYNLAWCLGLTRIEKFNGYIHSLTQRRSVAVSTHYVFHHLSQSLVLNQPLDVAVYLPSIFPNPEWVSAGRWDPLRVSVRAEPSAEQRHWKAVEAAIPVLRKVDFFSSDPHHGYIHGFRVGTSGEVYGFRLGGTREVKQSMYYIYVGRPALRDPASRDHNAR